MENHGCESSESLGIRNFEKQLFLPLTGEGKTTTTTKKQPESLLNVNEWAYSPEKIPSVSKLRMLF